MDAKGFKLTWGWNSIMKTKILVYGAGVIGSIFAGKLSLAGNDVTILARGKRYEEISSGGLILKDAMTGKTSRIGIMIMSWLSSRTIKSMKSCRY
jgi:2-dehydropantoate 2-reductase